MRSVVVGVAIALPVGTLNAPAQTPVDAGVGKAGIIVIDALKAYDAAAREACAWGQD